MNQTTPGPNKLFRMNNQKKQELQRLLWMANAQGFYPDKSAVELEAGYQHWLMHRQQYTALYQNFKRENFHCNQICPKSNNLVGSIVFTFHYGPYFLSPRYLLASGYQVTLLVSAAVLQKEREKYAMVVAQMGLPADCLECLDANDRMVLRKMLHAVRRGRVLLVFLDANESAGKGLEKNQDSQLRVAFGQSYFYWRSNLLKLALRFAIPVNAIHLSPQRGNAGQTWSLADPITILTANDIDRPLALLNAFAKLQQVFQSMMAQDWTGWENWGLIHHYREFDKRKSLDDSVLGTWMAPFSFADKGYLFDFSTKLFYEIVAKKDNLF